MKICSMCQKNTGTVRPLFVKVPSTDNDIVRKIYVCPKCMHKLISGLEELENEEQDTKML